MYALCTRHKTTDGRCTLSLHHYQAINVHVTDRPGSESAAHGIWTEKGGSESDLGPKDQVNGALTVAVGLRIVHEVSSGRWIRMGIVRPWET